MSRQLAWKRKKLALGQCPICGNGRLNTYLSACDPCVIRHRAKSRERFGGEAWKPGSRGVQPRLAE